jgi:hypothetical protein
MRVADFDECVDCTQCLEASATQLRCAWQVLGRFRECSGTYLFMGREDCEARAGGFMLIWSSERPEGNGASTELSEP